MRTVKSRNSGSISNRGYTVYSPPRYTDRLWGLPVSQFLGNGCKEVRGEGDHSPRPVPWLRSVEIYFHSPYAFMLCCLTKKRKLYFFKWHKMFWFMLMMWICSVESYDKEKEIFLAASKETGLEVNAGMKRIKSSLKSENTCYHSVQNLVSSGLPSKNIKNKIHRNVIFPVAHTDVKRSRSRWGRNVVWGCSRKGCWGEYLGLRQARWQDSGRD